MTSRRELATFATVLGLILAGFFAGPLFGGKVLSSADVLFVSSSFRECGRGVDDEPENRLLMDPVLQFQPWVEFNRAMVRRGRLPLWNSMAGCGAPHLANAQSAVFDPFQVIAYLGPLPDALGWMAWGRLWVAGLGMFVLARSWGLYAWGRWFAGLTFPFSGFLVLWLMFPVTNVAVWMPWVFWTSERVLGRASPRRVGALALAVGFTVLGGHIQTSAHVLLAAGLYAVWRVGGENRWAGLVSWTAGVLLGLTISAVTIVPLAVYLGKSPVWEDRQRDCPSPLRMTRPRLPDSVCTAIPYAFGSQRRGHPNLARPLGVHNLNESAGGYAGLATLLWLAPQGWLARRRQPRVVFLTGLAWFGFLGAFGAAPVANLLRASPVLNVMDQRRLTLWVAFGLVMLGGIGLDSLALRWRSRAARYWVSLWVAAAVGMLVAAMCLPLAEKRLHARAVGHYARAAERGDGDPAVYRARADRQVRAALRFVPRLLALTGLELAAIAGLASLSGRGRGPIRVAQASLLGLTVSELFAFGFGLNPAIGREKDRPETAVVARLRELAGRSGRVLGVGEEWPPNVAMRYGMADPRNYDSVELSRSLDWFAPLYGPCLDARSSRRTVSWAGVERARDRLHESGVRAVVSAMRPPGSLGRSAGRVGSAWVVGLDAAPKVGVSGRADAMSVVDDHGRIRVDLTLSCDDTLVVRETYDDAWRARWTVGRLGSTLIGGTFLALGLNAGRHRVVLTYDPPEVRAACWASLSGAVFSAALLAGFRPGVRPDFPPKGLDASERSG